jgi:hypothetical protein
MGKKRRILTRSAKFANKYFEFLDKVDRTTNVIDPAEVDDSLERVSPFVDTMSIADNNNQTITVTGQVIGDVENMGVEDKVEVKIGSGEWVESGRMTDNNAGAGRGRYTYSFTSVGASEKRKQLKVTVRPKGSTDKSLQKVATKVLRENHILLAFTAGDQAADAFQNNVTPNNIKLDLSDVSITSGKKKAGDLNDATLGDGAHDIGIRIEVFLASDTAKASPLVLHGDDPYLDRAAAINFGNADGDKASLLKNPITADTDFIVRVTPFSADATPVLLTESAIEKAVSVTHQE